MQDIEALDKIPMLTKEIVSILYKVLCDEIVDLTKCANEYTMTDFLRNTSNFSTLVSYVQSFEAKKGVISQSLKFGKKYVDAFGSMIIPQLGKIFKSENESILILLKKFQKGTKMLHVSNNACPIYLIFRLFVIIQRYLKTPFYYQVFQVSVKAWRLFYSKLNCSCQKTSH